MTASGCSRDSFVCFYARCAKVRVGQNRSGGDSCTLLDRNGRRSSGLRPTAQGDCSHSRNNNPPYRPTIIVYSGRPSTTTMADLGGAAPWVIPARRAAMRSRVACPESTGMRTSQSQRHGRGNRTPRALTLLARPGLFVFVGTCSPCRCPVCAWTRDKQNCCHYDNCLRVSIPCCVVGWLRHQHWYST